MIGQSRKLLLCCFLVCYFCFFSQGFAHTFFNTLSAPSAELNTNAETKQYARIYFLGSGEDVYQKPHTDEKPLLPSLPQCSASYRYICTAPKVGVGQACNGKYAVPCICPAEFNQNCTDATLIGLGPSCDGKYQNCQCGYSYYKTCTGRYEGKGQGCFLNPSQPLYQQCQCKSKYQYTSQNCSGDNHPSGDSCEGAFENCVCNPQNFTKSCDAHGELGLGASCQGKYKDCLCEEQFKYDNSNCNGDDYPVGETCGGKAAKCECNPKVFNQMCTGPGESGFGAQCMANGGYKNCVCDASYKYDAQSCDLEDHKLVGESCGGKYPNCECVSEKFLENCDENGQEGVGESCHGKFKSCQCGKAYQLCEDGPAEGAQSCTIGEVVKYDLCKPKCNDDCPAGYSKEDPGVPSFTQTTECSTVCYLPEPPCADGFSIAVTSCDAGYSLVTHGSYDGQACNKCEVKACEMGSTTYPDEASCGVLGGWDWQNVGQSGSEICGQCSKKECPLDYSSTVKSCEMGYELEVNGKSGNEDCSKCVEMVCPVGFSINYQSENDCGNGQHTEGWLFSSSGQSGTLKCGKCEAKSCDGESSTSITSLTSCGTSGDKGWSFAVASFAGDEACGLCSKLNCNADYTPGAKSCGAGYEEEVDAARMNGDEICSKCVQKSCPAGEVIGAACQGEGWDFRASGQMSGGNACGDCTAKACAVGYDTSTTTCGTGYKLETQGMSGNKVCGKCAPLPCPGSEIGESSCSGEGWVFEASANMSGLERCGLCKPKTCPANTETEKYSTSYTSQSSCESGWEFSSTTHYSGDLMCGKCTNVRIMTPLPIVYVRNNVIEILDYFDPTRKEDVWGIKSGGVAVKKTNEKTQSWSGAMKTASDTAVGGKKGVLATRSQFKSMYQEKSKFNDTVSILVNGSVSADPWINSVYWTSESVGMLSVFTYDLSVGRESNDLILSSYNVRVTLAIDCPSGEIVERGCTGVGWDFAESGSLSPSREKCGVCTAKTCPSGEGIDVQDCDKSETSGWEVGATTANYAGDAQCKLCRAKACPVGEVTVDGCSDMGWTFTPKSEYSGNEVCGTCTASVCPVGYSTSYQSVNDCGSGTHAEGWNYESSGVSGALKCGKCEAKSCSGLSSTDVTNAAGCGLSGTKGWAFEVASYAGDMACGLCTKLSCTGDYTPGAKNCGAGYEEDVDAARMNGDEVCSRCVQTACPVGYSTSYQSVNDCGSGAHAEGWNYESSGVSGALKCGKCEAKSCPSGYETGKASVADCGSRGANGWTFTAGSAYSGDEKCNSCTARSCPTNYNKNYQTVSDCGVGGSTGWSFAAHATRFYGDEKCGRCTSKNGCASGFSESITSTGSCGVGGSIGWTFTNSNGGYYGNTRCGKCTIRVGCNSGFSHLTLNASDCGSTGSEGWTLATSGGGYYGNNLCGKCVAKSCQSGYSTSTVELDCRRAWPSTDLLHHADGFSGDSRCYSCISTSAYCTKEGKLGCPWLPSRHGMADGERDSECQSRCGRMKYGRASISCNGAFFYNCID